MSSMSIVIFCSEGNKENYETLLASILGCKYPRELDKIDILPIYCDLEGNYIKEFSQEGFHVKEIKGKNVVSATEPRIYNCALDYVIRKDYDYVVFFLDRDVILYENLLVYYLWLFKNSHAEDFLSAVCPHHNVIKKCHPPTLTKMWYSDDVLLRGLCIKGSSLKEVGPFDESLKKTMCELDFVNRLTFHTAKLIRVGKELTTMYKLSSDHMTKDVKKSSFLEKATRVIFIRKWENRGRHPLIFALSIVTDEKISEETPHLSSLFVNQEEFFSKTLQERLCEIKEDPSTMMAIKMSPSFLKKEIFKSRPKDTSIFLFGNSEFSSYIKPDKRTFELLWKANILE